MSTVLQVIKIQRSHRSKTNNCPWQHSKHISEATGSCRGTKADRTIILKTVSSSAGPYAPYWAAFIAFSGPYYNPWLPFLFTQAVHLYWGTCNHCGANFGEWWSHILGRINCWKWPSILELLQWSFKEWIGVLPKSCSSPATSTIISRL